MKNTSLRYRTNKWTNRLHICHLGSIRLKWQPFSISRQSQKGQLSETTLARNSFKCSNQPWIQWKTRRIRKWKTRLYKVKICLIRPSTTLTFCLNLLHKKCQNKIWSFLQTTIITWLTSSTLSWNRNEKQWNIYKKCLKRESRNRRGWSRNWSSRKKLISHLTHLQVSILGIY